MAGSARLLMMFFATGAQGVTVSVCCLLSSAIAKSTSSYSHGVLLGNTARVLPPEDIAGYIS